MAELLPYYQQHHREILIQNNTLHSAQRCSSGNGGMNHDQSDGHVRKPLVQAMTGFNPKQHAAAQYKPKRAYTLNNTRDTKSDDSLSFRGDRPLTLPAQLLDDLRKRHNLTPAAAKGSSFSKSIPITDSERQTREDLEHTHDSDSEGEHQMAQDVLPTKEHSDDDSTEEKISSAVFVPHQSSREARKAADKDAAVAESLNTVCEEDEHRGREQSEEPEPWLVEHEIIPCEDEIRTGFTSPAKLSPEIGIRRARTASGYFSQSSGTVDSLAGPVSDADYSTKGDESELENNDDFEATPTDKTIKEHMASHQRRPMDVPVPSPAPTSDALPPAEDKQAVTKAPREAIDLIPYKHQVGGHTTLWRFSKRAVCKQLNNRENEFYETVEHYHPALLKFMPR